MSRIDPRNVIVLVRDSSDAIVRIGVSHWQELREVIRTEEADDKKRFKEIETQVGKALNTGVASS
ncbi:MAG: hypothetical protein CL477_03600 [Acidobacteria bacterium]|jgi:hypothetical protein|nr:hypothetical protein [Acidobacteriota bacterium]HJN46518.1 hypothetical protein [Vicinamibacterales bacterium]|tara:strand:- start:945 stop:1139 length:195 start_codon:yes stop_codon:yes gene_type:complete